MRTDPPAIVRQVEDAAQLVEFAKAARQQAETVEEEASPSRWREADAYAALARLPGWTVRKIADECGTSKSVVGRFVQIVSHYWDKSNRPSFWAAFSEVIGEKTSPPLPHA
jgi:hypothetical protein